MTNHIFRIGLYSIAIIVFPELTPDSKKKFIAAIIGVVIAVAGVLGPVIGGLFTHYLTWRWVFWIKSAEFPLFSYSVLKLTGIIALPLDVSLPLSFGSRGRKRSTSQTLSGELGRISTTWDHSCLLQGQS